MAKKKERNPWNALLVLLAFPIIVYAFSSGPPLGVTGGFLEPTCNQLGCHVGPPAVNGGPGSVAIAVPGTYNSSETLSVTVTVSDPEQQRWGFELSARTNPGGQQAGTLISTDGLTQVRTQNGIQYISHTLQGTRNGTLQGTSFNFMWQAPDVSAGEVIFHAAGNAANGDFNNTGDRIYTTSATSQPQPISGQPPSVFDGGVVDGASFVLHPNPLAPGSIVSIFGTDLTDGSIKLSFFDSNGKLATTLAGAQVTFNGIAAPLFYASPLQINAQLPTESTGVDSATVEVTVNGQTSTPRTVIIGPVSPGIFTVDQNGSGAGAIHHEDFSLVTSQNPAAPGEIVLILCTGLGPVTNPPASGAPASLDPLSETTTTPLTVTMDGLAAVVLFSGLTPDSVGLYEVNVVVPANTRTANDIPIVLTIGGKDSNLGKTVTIVVAETGGT